MRSFGYQTPGSKWNSKFELKQLPVRVDFFEFRTFLRFVYPLLVNFRGIPDRPAHKKFMEFGTWHTPFSGKLIQVNYQIWSFPENGLAHDPILFKNWKGFMKFAWMRFPEIGPTGKFELRKQLDEFSMKQLTRKTESHQTIRLQKNDGILVSKWYVTVKYPVCNFSLKTA